MQEQATFERNFGQETGRFFQQLLESHGVILHAADQLERFAGDGSIARSSRATASSSRPTQWWSGRA